jgi:uncharacterized protein YceK
MLFYYLCTHILKICKMKKIPLMLMSLVLMSSCATIVSRSSYPVTISSNPSNAHFKITDQDNVVVYEGTTPQTVRLDASSGYFKKASYAINFSMPGYVDTTTVVRSKLDGWYIGNFVFGGLIGWLGVDPLTGAMYSIPYRNIFVSLKKDEAATLAQRNDSIVVPFK